MSEARAGRVEAQLRERELDALIVTDLVNIRWLSGFSGTSAACVVTADGRRVFLTDFRYVERAREEVEGFGREQAGRDLLADVAKLVSGRVGFEDGHLAVRPFRKLESLVGEGVELVAAGSLLEDLRAVKEPAELDAIRAAARLADEVLSEVVLARPLAGRREREVAAGIEQAIRERGGEPSFPPIVAAGAHGALPHAEPRDVAIEPGELVVVDWGARLDGYCSDCTRTLASGEPGEEALAVYELVERAQAAALAALRPGIACKDVDSVARELIAAAGHGERFGHGLGHGVGLEVHEEPRLTQSGEGELEPGNVVTIEPGVYLPGELGVRIEDLVVVGDRGPEVLSGLPKQLTQV